MQSQFNKKVSKLPVKLCGSIKQAFREQPRNMITGVLSIQNPVMIPPLILHILILF